MPKVSVIVVIYNGRQYIKPVFDGIFGQTHKNLEVIAVINKDSGEKDILQREYSNVRIVDPGRNTGFAEGNNLGIKSSSGEFIQLVNQDLILESNYIEKMLKAFDDPKVAAATGKILRYDFAKNEKTNIIDSTGIVMSVSGRARDRGQNQIDKGQFDKFQILNSKFQTVFGVSGAAPMYRRLALEKVKNQSIESVTKLTIVKSVTDNINQHGEYFDQDFFMYWEDVDLSWRLNNAGYLLRYVPAAVGYHGRTAGQAQGGYLHFWHFVHHHYQLSPMIRQLNYKNHILMYIKNAKHIWHPAFILRELVMLCYIIIFEFSTLKVIPELFRQIPRALRKRKAA